jgi:prepilin-type N-terminal cleavage/methylation domain-containing protein
MTLLERIRSAHWPSPARQRRAPQASRAAWLREATGAERRRGRQLSFDVPPARRGMTLLELILVMFILALVLGAGVGTLSSFDLGERQAAGLVRTVLRSAQNTAIASTAPARVRIDPAAGRLHAESIVTVATYAFEARRVEGYGPAGGAEPELFDPRGFVGDCVRSRGLPRETAEIPLARDPACDFTLGFSVASVWAVDANGRVDFSRPVRRLTEPQALALLRPPPAEPTQQVASASRPAGWLTALLAALTTAFQRS